MTEELAGGVAGRTAAIAGDPDPAGAAGGAPTILCLLPAAA